MLFRKDLLRSGRAILILDVSYTSWLACTFGEKEKGQERDIGEREESLGLISWVCLGGFLLTSEPSF
jgi:hypothetical protein